MNSKTVVNYSNGSASSQWIKPPEQEVIVNSENQNIELLNAVILLAHQLDFQLTEKHKQTSAFQRLRKLEKQMSCQKSVKLPKCWRSYEPKLRSADARILSLLQQGNEQAVIELRALNYEGRKNNTFSGYFDQEDSFVAAAKLATKKSGGVYCTINVCNPQLLSRRANRAVPYADLTTSDQDIFQRRYLPIDLDPERPAGTSSSEEQHEAAIERSHEVFEFMKQNQWNEP